MRIERIEVIGFKSFADKTVFNFHPGITSVVGPNGCGKSNIVDAFKWVLGEQSAKSLRGGSMEDVIFSGSATKKTKGMAEVTLVLSDIVKKTSGGSGSGDRDETEVTKISVTRRLFRSGESEYLMNKVPCRLKDIKNMFLDTGLELKAYSILEQGRIGDIVNSKPQDRRFLIEEVAGVMKYKVRKNEALNKLESSKSNLQRLQDIIAEVKRQINTINRHAKKAERYKILFEEIKDIETRSAKRDFKAFVSEIESLSQLEDALKSREAESSAKVHSVDALIEEKKRLCIEQEKSLAGIRSHLYALEKEATEDEGKIALLKNDCTNLGERLTALSVQDSDMDVRRERTADSLKEIEITETEMNSELSKLENILKEKNDSFTKLDNEIRGYEHDLDSQRKNLFNKAEEISNIKNEINHFALRIEGISRKTEKSSQDIHSLNDSLSSLQTAAVQAREEQVRCESELRETREAKENMVSRLRDRREELTLHEKVLYREREELAAIGSKLESLKEMDRSRMSSHEEHIKTICQVADILDTPPEYENAIEAVLGDKLRADIVADQNELSNALQFIRENSSKRSGFITANPLRSFDNVLSPGLSVRDGVIGEAVRFVSAKQGFENVAKALLSDVILVENLDVALSLQGSIDRDAGRSGFYFVTRDGDVLEPSGMVFGGCDRGVLKVKRQIKELENDMSVKKDVISEAERSIASIKEDIISAENEIISIDGKISSQEKYSHGLKVKMENLDEESVRLNKKHEYISLEITDDHREKDHLTGLLQQKESESTERELAKQQIEERIRSVQDVLSQNKEAFETMRSELTEIKLNLAATGEKMASVKREVERLGEMISEIDRNKIEMANERQSIEEVIARKEQEVVDKESALASKIVKVGELQTEAAQVNEILEARSAELSLLEKQQKELSAGLETIRGELSQLEMKKMEQSMKMNYLKEDIYKTYSIEIASADISDTVTREEEEKLPELKEKLQSIGPVSLGTIDEYEELKERFEFLTKQRDDLLESISALEDTIQKINRTTKKRLEDAFEELNAKFKEVFTSLFGKGRAELQLTEGSILDAGIEIIAQPPGKRLQNMMLLSGGEKALTALSLLFAGFMIKPTPLCLLDEVDAPLDESNTDRFIKLLTEMAKGIQFIAITHNRRTMEAADYIYGITMEEPGSSKVISMHLAEAV
jgi:chromosome segregation protein